VVAVEVMVNSLLVVSQPKPEDSEVIEEEPSKKAICPEVPVPETPPEPTVQVTTLLEPSTQRALPVPEAKPVMFKLEPDPLAVTKVISPAPAGSKEILPAVVVVKFKAWELAAAILNAPPAGPVMEAAPSASTKVKSPVADICNESVPLPISTRSVALNKISSEEVKVISPVPEVKAKAVAPVPLPIVIVLAAAPVPMLIAWAIASLPIPIAPPEELICKAPVASISKVDAEIAPASPPSPKLKAPVVVKVPAIVVVSKAEAMLMASAVVLFVPILMVLPAVPVPKLIVLALLPVPKLTVPVVPESSVIAEEVVEEIVPAPANVIAVADTAIVSIEATPVKAPPVVTFNPPLLVKAKVPVALPIAVLPVEEVFKFKVGAVIAAVPEARVRVKPVKPVEEIAPEVEVKERAPVVIVKPLEAVNVEATVAVLSKVTAPSTSNVPSI
jgi:hypothetical protein